MKRNSSTRTPASKALKSAKSSPKQRKKRSYLSQSDQEARNQEMRLQWTSNPAWTYQSIADEFGLKKTRAYEILNGVKKATDRTSPPNKTERKAAQLTLQDRRKRLLQLQFDNAEQLQQKTQEYTSKLDYWLQSFEEQALKLQDKLDSWKGDPETLTDEQLDKWILVKGLFEGAFSKTRSLMEQIVRLSEQAARQGERTQVLIQQNFQFNEGQTGADVQDLVQAIHQLNQDSDVCQVCGAPIIDAQYVVEAQPAQLLPPAKKKARKKKRKKKTRRG